uniref:HSPB1 associated protein 1 n=1 Tax=Sphenodon punctatus TaxID=8508 RepID=A0A8D0HDB2_SPHPU
MAEAAALDPPLLGEDVKPFTPEEAREIVMSLEKPAVFRNMVLDWPALHWNVKYLCEMLGSKTLQFRMGVKKMDTAPQFETKCSFVEATLEEFLAWNCEPSACSSGPFHSYDSSKYWAYADYKYIARIFEDKADIFQEEMEERALSGLARRKRTLLATWILTVVIWCCKSKEGSGGICSLQRRPAFCTQPEFRMKNPVYSAKSTSSTLT